MVAPSFTSHCAASSTARAYLCAWLGFARWCAARGHLARPARCDVVAVYLMELCRRGRAVPTIRRALIVIDEAHELAGLPRPTSAACVRDAWASIRRGGGVPPTQGAVPRRKRSGLEAAEGTLMQLVQQCTPRTFVPDK